MSKNNFFNSYFREIISPVEVSLFTSSNPLTGFECFYSSAADYNEGDYYGIYSLTPLMRVLFLKDDLVSSDILDHIYKENPDYFCKILHWSRFQKRVLFIKITDRALFDQDKFFNKMEDVNILNRAFAGQYSERKYEF